MAPPNGRFGAVAGENSNHRNCTGSHQRVIDCGVAEPRALARRVPGGDIDVSTVPDIDQPSAQVVTRQPRTAIAPRITFSPQGFAIDHPDPALGEKLMAEALGVADRDAMEGMLRQLVRACTKGRESDAVSLAFMISMIESIKPRDAVEAMLVAQMVTVHVMTMRSAHDLVNAEDVVCHENAGRALARLTRTFPIQMEALNRYRSHGEPAITVQNVSVGDGGKAIVGNVTHHASVIVADPDSKRAAPA